MKEYFSKDPEFGIHLCRFIYIDVLLEKDRNVQGELNSIINNLLENVYLLLKHLFN
jgi:hypothetical protein